RNKPELLALAQQTRDELLSKHRFSACDLDRLDACRRCLPEMVEQFCVLRFLTDLRSACDAAVTACHVAASSEHERNVGCGSSGHVSLLQALCRHSEPFCRAVRGPDRTLEQHRPTG